MLAIAVYSDSHLNEITRSRKKRRRSWGDAEEGEKEVVSDGHTPAFLPPPPMRRRQMEGLTSDMARRQKGGRMEVKEREEEDEVVE